MRFRSLMMRYLTALASTLGACAVYALVLAPLIEGGPARMPGGPLIPPEGIRPPDEIMNELAGLFPEDGWEWKNCNILESRQAKLLFRRYEILDDGSVRLEPLTMVLMSEEPGDDGKQPPAPVVLRAPWGANVEFENGLQLGGNPGNLKSAQLKGEVQIYRPNSAPDSNDSLYLVTQNVQISRERIFTLYECQFQFGQSYGRGKHLTIDLTGPGGPRQNNSPFSGIERIELGQVDELLLHQQPDPDAAAETSGDDLAAGVRESLQIRCAGPMVYEYAAQRTSFADDVVVRTLDGQNQLNCEDLMVYLGSPPLSPREKRRKKKQAGGHQGSGVRLQVQRLVATGTPVVLTAGTENAQVTAERVDLDLINQTVVLSSRQSAWLMRNGQQIQAPEIRYTFTEDGRLGTAEIQGPGTIRQQADQQQDGFECHWQTRLTLQDDGGQKVLALDQARVALTDLSLDADQLYLWMREIPETDEPTGRTRYRMTPARMLAEGSIKIKSPRLEGVCSQAAAYWPEPASGSAAHNRPDARYVTVRRASWQQQMSWQQDASPIPATTGSQPADRLTWNSAGPDPARGRNAAHGSTTAAGHLQWQQQPAQQQPVQQQPVQATGFQQEFQELPAPRIENPTQPAEPSAGKTRFSGRQVQLQMLGGEDPGLIDEITVDGEVVVQQYRATPENEFEIALEIRGSTLRAVTSGDEQNRLYVAGTARQPATVAARQIIMSGTEIHLDQTANQLWIDGAGQMQLTPEIQAASLNPTPAPQVAGGHDLLAAGETTVRWAGGMVFNGQKIYFETDVQSHSRQVSATDRSVTTTTTQSAALSIVLNQYLDFQSADAESGTDDLQAERLMMVGWMDAGQAAFPATHQENQRRRVWVAAARYDARGQMISNQELFAPRAAYDVSSGMMDCNGRGNVIVRQLAATGSTDNATPARLTASGKRSGPIDFVQINYDDSFRGNLEQRHLTFQGNVHTFYTDCRQWNEVPPESILNQPGRRGMILDCDQLEMAQWAPAGGAPVADLTATGSARVRGSQFNATAERISYFEGNGLVTIEAPSRGDAEFWFNRPGQTGRGHLIARRIIYNVETETYEVDQMKQIDYSDKR